ncbi:MAG: DEAD/DEAH box helicase [Methanobrevibacter sp.]|nr:DEAD/DEAH box helicase [Methanobrevibacter sp.]
MIIFKRTKKSWIMYPIGSPKGALNTKRIPEFVGFLKFEKNAKGVSINKFIAKYNEEEKLIPPSEVIKLLRSQTIFLTSKDKEMESFLKLLNIDYRFTRICSHCTLEGNITIINSSFSYSYHNQNICKICAEETIKRELKLQRFDKKSFKNFKRILNKTGNLDKVLSMINHNFDPVANLNLTLFDEIKTYNNKKIPQVKLNRLKIPKKFKKILLEENNEYLLPVQYLAIKNGLLKDEDLLVVSATASGKTLIGELAGIPKAIDGKKFIFLTPLVALANQKYRDFKKRYESLGLKVSIKVGMNRIKAKEELKIPSSSIKDADIIVGTYEGIDFLLRSGKSDYLKDLGLILIDEIHTLDDDERGIRLYGLIKRIENIYPSTQIIGLSATVKNPKYLTEKFNMKLVQYDFRPVPLKRHLIFVRSEVEKRNIIRKLVLKEFKTKSSKGFSGQTIIFTNSRRKTHQIANYLNRNRINASPYHAGLSYFKKEKIEKNFASGKISAVVTTSALAAGVDFPASSVIFETLLMGNRWISPNEFSQMVGRAGRPSYHDRGVVYLLPEISNKFDGESEESVAISLLEGDVEKVSIDYNENDTLEQILADICSHSLEKISEIHDFYEKLPIPMSVGKAIDELYDKGLIAISNKNKNNSKLKSHEYVQPTSYGKAVAMSFLDIENGEFIKNSLLHRSKKEDLYYKFMEIAMDLEYFESAYLAPAVHKQIVNTLKVNFSTRLFSESTMDIISSGDTIAKLDTKFQEALLKIQIDFLQCKCKDKPFCTCLQKGVSEFIINERLKRKDPTDISKDLFSSYQIQTYSGDVFSWLDKFVRNLEAVKRIANSLNDVKSEKIANDLIKKIEKG